MKNIIFKDFDFYLFSPITLKTKFYYRSKDDLDNDLVLLFARKTYPHIAVDIRTNPLFLDLFENLFKVTKRVPNKNVFLIYMGHDSTLYFIKEHEAIYLIKYCNGKFTKEKFKGFPIHYNFKNSKIPNKKLLIKTLREHFKNIKYKKIKIHGDFTVYNILVDDSQRITIIDKKKNNSKSLLTDHFYFYVYFLMRVQRHNPFNKKMFKASEKQLFEIYQEVFKDEDCTLLNEIDKIEYSDFPMKKSEHSFQKWKRVYKELMVKILKEI